jgi:hypothetical protein
MPVCRCQTEAIPPPPFQVYVIVYGHGDQTIGPYRLSTWQSGRRTVMQYRCDTKEWLRLSGSVTVLRSNRAVSFAWILIRIHFCEKGLTDMESLPFSSPSASSSSKPAVRVSCFAFLSWFHHVSLNFVIGLLGFFPFGLHQFLQFHLLTKVNVNPNPGKTDHSVAPPNSTKELKLKNGRSQISFDLPQLQPVL